jgi:hypothetical protein
MKRSRKLNIRRRRRSIKGGKPSHKLYQAKLVNIHDTIYYNDDITDRDQIETFANEYVNNRENGMNIGDILFCGTKRGREENGFYLVLPGEGNNKRVICLNDGWGMGWISGGVIDKKDILHEYNVKYDDLLSQKRGIHEFDNYFLGYADSSLPQEIRDEFRKNKLLS